MTSPFPQAICFVSNTFRYKQQLRLCAPTFCVMQKKNRPIHRAACFAACTGASRRAQTPSSTANTSVTGRVVVATARLT